MSNEHSYQADGNETAINLRLIIHIDGEMIVNQDDDVVIDVANNKSYAMPVINGRPYDIASYLLIQVNTDELPGDISDVAEDLMTLGMWVGALGLAVQEHVKIHCLPFIESENADEVLAFFTEEEEDDGCDGEGFICDDCMRKLMDEPEFE